jgi:hypothetical protein
MACYMLRFMRNALIAVLVIIVCVLVYQNHKLSSAKPKVQLASVSLVASLELQAQCAKQANIVAKTPDYNGNLPSGSENHYSLTLGRCFVSTESTKFSKGALIESKLVQDAFEQKVYGSFLSVSTRDKPVTCEVWKPNGEEISCNSSQQFDELMKLFMES